ncbi:OmpA family protein [Streptomyces sp. W16]|uniref:OmpA family protein n=1 Tax=Streptomyces sp. W16 TaxID=3076631 RepID=UPI003FA35AB8
MTSHFAAPDALVHREGVPFLVEDQDGAERRKDTNTEVTYELSAEVLFAKDSSRLSSSARSRIAASAAEIKQGAVKNVRVFGFTDNLGSSAHGDVLSQQRADAVQAVLADALPSTVSFEARGFGEWRPVASNTTEAGRRKNSARRDLVPANGELPPPIPQARPSGLSQFVSELTRGHIRGPGHAFAVALFALLPTSPIRTQSSE